MGTNYYAVKNKPTVFSPIHIGKSSMGWKFCFHKVCSFEKHITEEPLNTFPQWKNFLEEQTANGNIVIMDEYDRVISLDDFLKMVEIKQKVNNPDDFTYSDNIDGYRFESGEFS